MGRIASVRGMLTARLPAAVGDGCWVEQAGGGWTAAEVIAVQGAMATLLPLEPCSPPSRGGRVISQGRSLRSPVGAGLFGRILDGLGRPLDGQGPLRNSLPSAAVQGSPMPMNRPKIEQPFVTGQRAIDGLITLGRGQRVGLFAGSGVGKSTLLGEIAKRAESDVNVIALIGERGREVRPFIEDCLGSQGRQRSAVFVSTSDEAPLMKVRCARAAIAAADAARRQGRDVLLMMDSITRLATAQREIGLMAGEPPTARGYTPSVFQLLAELLEQLGASEHGSITAIVTVLVDGDDMDEPIADAVRSIVDGHIVLDRRLAEQGHFPAIHVGGSVSRVMRDVAPPNQFVAASAVRTAMAVYEDAADLIRVGAYSPGASPEIDRAVALRPAILEFTQQAVDAASDWNSTQTRLLQLGAAWSS